VHTVQEEPLTDSSVAPLTPTSPRSQKPQPRPAPKKSQPKAGNRGEHSQVAVFGRHGIGGLALFGCLFIYCRFGNLGAILAKLSPEQTYRLMMTLLVLTFCVTLIALVCDVFKKTRDGKLGTLIVIIVLIALAIAAWASMGSMRNNVEKANLEAHRWNVKIQASGAGAMPDSAAGVMQSAATFTGQINFRHDGSFDGPGRVTLGTASTVIAGLSPQLINYNKILEAVSEYKLASAGVLECPASIRGDWTYALDSRVMTGLQIQLREPEAFLHAGLSQQQSDQCAARLKTLIPKFAKITCRFTSNSGCEAPGFEITLTPKKEDGPTLMPNR
jgi:hypothetical protein